MQIYCLVLKYTLTKIQAVINTVFLKGDNPDFN